MCRNRSRLQVRQGTRSSPTNEPEPRGRFEPPFRRCANAPIPGAFLLTATFDAQPTKQHSPTYAGPLSINTFITCGLSIHIPQSLRARNRVPTWQMVQLTCPPVTSPHGVCQCVIWISGFGECSLFLYHFS